MEFIYTNKSLKKEHCDKIIEYYENESNLKYQGVTFGGLDKRIKDTVDLIIPHKTETENKWNEINDILSNDLEKNLKIYVKNLNSKDNYSKINNYNREFKNLYENLYLVNNFMIQKYDKNKGKYVYHDDGAIDILSKNYRVITYLWYLNDVEQGGETEFFGGDLKIKPETGKLLFFPSFWCYPHRGNKPVSSSKYIITGWLYKKIIEKKDIKQLPYIAPPNKITLDEEPDNNVDDDKNDKSDKNDKNDKSEDNEKDNKSLSEEELVFDYFYRIYPYIFKDHKNYLLNNKTFLEILNINNMYSNIICLWLVDKIKSIVPLELWNNCDSSIIKYNELELFPDVLPFIISSFQIISDMIKFKYNLSPNLNFNITKWYVVNSTLDHNKSSFLENNRCDLVIQIIISKHNNDNNIGDIYVGKHIQYKIDFEYMLVFFIDFSFIYINKSNNKINISLKDLASNMLGNIDI